MEAHAYEALEPQSAVLNKISAACHQTMADGLHLVGFAGLLQNPIVIVHPEHLAKCKIDRAPAQRDVKLGFSLRREPKACNRDWANAVIHPSSTLRFFIFARRRATSPSDLEGLILQP